MFTKNLSAAVLALTMFGASAANANVGETLQTLASVMKTAGRQAEIVPNIQIAEQVSMVTGTKLLINVKGYLSLVVETATVSVRGKAVNSLIISTKNTGTRMDRVIHYRRLTESVNEFSANNPGAIVETVPLTLKKLIFGDTEHLGHVQIRPEWRKIIDRENLMQKAVVDLEKVDAKNLEEFVSSLATSLERRSDALN